MCVYICIYCIYLYVLQTSNFQVSHLSIFFLEIFIDTCPLFVSSYIIRRPETGKVIRKVTLGLRPSSLSFSQLPNLKTQEKMWTDRMNIAPAYM